MKDKQIKIRLTADEHQQAKEFSKKQGTTISEIVRQSLKIQTEKK